MLRKLAGQTLIYGISSIVARLLNYLLTPYLTRINIMTPGEYGIITDMYAIIPFALVVLTMGMETGYFRFAGKAASEEEKKKVFATTWGAVSYLALIFMAAVILFKDSIAGALGYADRSEYILIVGAIITLDVICAIPFVRLREQGRAGRYVFIRVMSVLINVVLCVAFYSGLPRLAEAGILTSLYSPAFGAGYYMVANLIASVCVFAMLMPSCRDVRPRIERKLFRQIFIYSLPLLVSGVAGTANEFIDRQMIKFLMPEDEAMSALGIYGAVVKIGVIMILFTQMYRLGAEPFFLANFKKDDFKAANAEALKYYMIVSVFIFLTIALFSDWFALIVGPAFREGMFILPVVLGANILAGLVFNLSFWYKQTEQTKYAILITGTGLVFTVAFNLLLVPRYGYYGAAWARLICEAAMVGVSYGLNRRHFPTPYNLRRIAEYVFIGAVMFAAGNYTGQLGGVAKNLINFVMIAIFVLYAMRRERIDVRGLVRAVVRR